MKLLVRNLTGKRYPIPSVGTLAAHSDWQTILDFNRGSDFSFYSHGENAAERLRALEVGGEIEYQFVLDASDVGQVGVMKLTVRPSDLTTAGLVQAFTLPVEFPAGAMLLSAQLNVHEAVAGGAIATAVVASGLYGLGTAFDASEDVAATLTRRHLTASAVGTDISGGKLMLTLTTTVGNVNEATAGNLTLFVSYQVVPAL